MAQQRNAKRKKTGIVAVVEKGTLVWIPDTETGQVWVKAEVDTIDANSRTVRVRTDDGSERTANLDKLLRCNSDTWKAEDGLTAVNDLSSLTHLHEPEVLQALQLRFDIDKIYTFCGPILIVLNPFKLIAGLYDGTPHTESKDSQQHPHIFLIASRAYSNLVGRLQSQVVLISGESGAGKTESTKHVLRFLTTRLADGSAQQATPDNTMKKVLSSNPLLEAFGNACTTRNDNSSRFGKFIELQFESKGKAAFFHCAAIDTYLLEKIRITELHKCERSYHIFYQACAAKQRFGSEKNGLSLELFGDVASFSYLTRSDRFELDSVDDAELFVETQQAMDAMGISHAEQSHIINLVAAILHIGNIPMQEKGSTTEVSTADASFKLVCSVLGIQPPALAKALSYRLISVSQSEKYDTPLALSQSESLRESFARALYSYLFNFIVHRINQSLAGTGQAGQPAKRFFVGVLDIFGFEHFEKNSFEQLCINFANERLQQLFNQFVFKTEMEIYQKEAVSCDFTDFPDNQDIIDMIQGKQSSIFTMLDEECRLPKGSDQSFVQKLWKAFEKHPRFKVEPRRPSAFSVIHFAGTVSYETANFMDKNMDELGELLKQALESSKEPLLVSILELKRQKDASQSTSAGAKPGQRGGKLKPNTVCTDFKGQLESLMTKMGSACPHFVRCIKPNPEKRPDRYDRQSVAEQLRSGGVIEALCVQRAGFPCRWVHKECWENISIMFKLQQRAQYESMGLEERVQAALTALAKDLKWPAGTCYAIGKTKVFFKQSPFEALESHRIAILNDAATKIQASWKCHCKRQLYGHFRRATVIVQSSVRRYLQRKRVWDKMEPTVRRRSLLFRRHFLLIDQQPSTAGAGERQDGDGLSDVSETCELSASPTEDLARLQSLAAAHRKSQEDAERLRLQLREREEEARRMEEARAAAVEQERRHLQEERLQAERRWQEERDALESGHSQEVQKLEQKLQTAQKEEAVREKQREAEMQCLRREADVRRAEFEQQVALVQLREQEAKSQVEQLEREIQRLKQEMAAQAERHSAAISELQSAHAAALSHTSEQHEAQRQAYLKQIDEMREGLDQAQQQQQEASRAQEMEHTQRFKEEVQHLRDREAALRRRQEEELVSLRQRESDRQRKWQADLAEAQRHESDYRLQQQVMEQQFQDLKADSEQHRKLLEAQQEETKRMHSNQIEMLEQRHAERERSLVKELEITQAQRNEQVSTLRGQLEFQKRELVMTCQQEVEMIKRQWEQRERQLLQMLNQARLGQAEREKTAEVQLALKAQQQDELHRCADAKARHLEESARRQQELYEQHVEQLTQQMRESQENFRRLLEEAQAQNDERLAASVAQLATLEAQIKEDQEKRRAQEEAEREETNFKLAETAKLVESVRRMDQENQALQQQLAQAKAALSARSGGRHTPRGGPVKFSEDEQPKLVRRLSEPIPELVKDGSGMRRTRLPMRLLLGPRKMSMASSQPRETELSASSPRKPAAELFQARKSIGDLFAGVPRVNTQRGPATQAFHPFRFLCSTLRQTGQAGTADSEVGAWREIPATPASLAGRQADAAITILTFAEVRSDAMHWLLAAANKSGTLSVYSVRRTACECNESAPDEPKNGAPDIEVKVQFIAHAKAITSMSFSQQGRELMTTSSDWHVRIWNVQDGSLKNRFVDSSLVVCALPMPGPDWSMVMANAGAVLRLISTEGNQKQQKVRLDHYARSLVLALDGSRLLAGTSRGHIHALDVDAAGLRIVGKQQVSSQAALTCLVVAPCADGMPPLVVANSMDNTICTLQANVSMTNFTVLKRLPNPHKLLPLRCCHIPSSGEGARESGAGFIASASEDGCVHVIDLDGFQEMRLTGHGIPVVDVAVTNNSGLLASGDVHGRIILWRQGGAHAGE